MVQAKEIEVTWCTLIHSKYISSISPRVISGLVLSSLYTFSCHPLDQDANSASS